MLWNSLLDCPDNVQQHELELRKASLASAERENYGLHRINDALEESNNYRREMAERLTMRTAHLESVIQKGEQSLKEEREELAKKTAAYTSSTIEGLSAAFGEEFLKCYQEVGETKKQNAELKTENRSLKQELEDEKAALARSNENEAIWRKNSEDITAEHQALQEIDGKSRLTIEERDRKIVDLEKSLETAQKQYEKTSDILQEMEARRNELEDEVKVTSGQYQRLSTEFIDLTRTYQSVSSLKGFLEALAKCADNALNDGNNSLDQDWVRIRTARSHLGTNMLTVRSQ